MLFYKGSEVKDVGQYSHILSKGFQFPTSLAGRLTLVTGMNLSWTSPLVHGYYNSLSLLF